jgi:hypothetical protein
VAILGAGWVVIAGRRDGAEASPVPAAVEPDRAVAAIRTVDARARRRAQLRPSDDPILAALGLPDDQAAADDTAAIPAGERSRAPRRRSERD